MLGVGSSESSVGQGGGFLEVYRVVAEPKKSTDEGVDGRRPTWSPAVFAGQVYERGVVRHGA